MAGVARLVGSEKRCRVCGDEMDCYDYGGGSVWSCGVHGVRDWQFGDQSPQWARAAHRPLPMGRAAPRPPPARAAPAALPASDALTERRTT